MSDLFYFPEYTAERSRIILYRTPPPSWDDEIVLEWAERFGLYGGLETTDDLKIVTQGSEMLQVFLATHSLWWMDLERGEFEPDGPVPLPDEEQAAQAAQTILEERGLLDEHMHMHSVAYDLMTPGEPDQSEPYRIALNVIFRYSLDGLPISGPGAKASIRFDTEDFAVSEIYRFWREPVADHDREIIGPDQAIEHLMADLAFAELKADESQVVIHDIRLGYCALPPREPQGFLIPAYSFKGTVSTPIVEQFDFVKYVPAVDVSVEEFRQLEVAPLYSRPPLVFECG